MTSTAYDAGIPLGTGESRGPGWWAMVWTIATEAALFAFLLFSFFYLGSQSRSAWPPDGPLALKLALPNTFILILSSVAYIWGERGIRAGNRTRLRAGLRIAFILGLVFVIVQAIEWSHLPFGVQDQAFGSLFYTITGFHGAHVVVGLLMNAFVQIGAERGVYTRESHLAVTNAGMYWHFVDIVWLFVFASLYISPRLG